MPCVYPVKCGVSRFSVLQYATIPLSREIGVFFMEHYMTNEKIEHYLKALENEERAAATIEKYRRAILNLSS